MSVIQPDGPARALADGIEAEHAPKETLQALSVETVEPQGLTAKCSTRYTARRNSGIRPLSEIKLIVLHSTEGGTAQGAAAWFTSPDAQGSAHLCVDDNICYRTLDDKLIPWGARGANYAGYHIEQAGYARWLAWVWSKTHRQTLERAAYKAALRCRWYGIPPYFVTASQLKAGRPGVTTHNECTKAFGGSHWDPGTGWPRYYFMLRVRAHYKKLWHVQRIA